MGDDLNIDGYGDISICFNEQEFQWSDMELDMGDISGVDIPSRVDSLSDAIELDVQIKPLALEQLPESIKFIIREEMLRQLRNWMYLVN